MDSICDGVGSTSCLVQEILVTVAVMMSPIETDLPVH